MKSNEENWILIPNRVFDIERKDYLTIDESFLFSWLYRWQTIDHITLVNINFLNEFKELRFNSSSQKNNKKYIKELLISLQNKKYVLNVNKQCSEDEILKVKFYDADYYIKNKDGFNKHITYSLFENFKKPLEFYIYTYIDCYGDRGRSVSDNEWTALTDLSKPTIRKIIEQMNNPKHHTRIWKFSGDYIPDNNQPWQMVNSYYTRPNDDIKRKWYAYYGDKYKVKEDKKKVIYFKGFNGVGNKDQDEINHPF